MQARSNGTKRPAMLDYEADCNKSVSVCVWTTCRFYLQSGVELRLYRKLYCFVTRAVLCIHTLLDYYSMTMCPTLKYKMDFSNQYSHVCASDDRLERQREPLDNISGDRGSRDGGQWRHVTQV